MSAGIPDDPTLAAADGVQLVLHLGGEAVIDQIRQVASSNWQTAKATQVGTSRPRPT